jgi:molybdopterin converting factor small subunit
MAVIRIPSSLAQYADGARSVALEGATVEDVLRDLGDRFPALRARALDGDGGPRPHVTLFLNRTQITARGDLRTAVGEGDEIAIISAIAGG